MAPSGVEADIKALAKYFNLKNCKCKVDKKSGVPQLTHNGQTVSGLASIATFLVQCSGQPYLYPGSSHLNKAQIQQWLEYRVTMVDRCLNEKDVSTVLQELNSFLHDRVYFVADTLTVADLLLYFGLYPTFNCLTLQEKEKYLHLSRWFNNVQHEAKLDEFFPVVPFSLNYLYQGVSEHWKWRYKPFQISCPSVQGVWSPNSKKLLQRNISRRQLCWLGHLGQSLQDFKNDSMHTQDIKFKLWQYLLCCAIRYIYAGIFSRHDFDTKLTILWWWKATFLIGPAYCLLYTHYSNQLLGLFPAPVMQAEKKTQNHTTFLMEVQVVLHVGEISCRKSCRCVAVLKNHSFSLCAWMCKRFQKENSGIGAKMQDQTKQV